jgi:hypothetical protein
MNKKVIAQITLFLVITSALSGMLLGTEVYSEVHDGIVDVLCLSCLKLDPKISVDFADFTFKTATNDEHPRYVLDNLTTGIVFLHFSEDACTGCDIMYPIVQELLSVEYGKTEMYSTQISYQNEIMTYYYTNIDHAISKRIEAFDIYDSRNLNGLPMFTIVTLGYDQGIIKPTYITMYGTLGEDTDEKRMQILASIIDDAIELWNENIPGYEP